MNLPNALTVSRFFLAVLFVVLLNENSLRSTIFAACVFAVASLTDLLDGYIAKTQGLITDFGKIMDPVADKVLILAAFIMFVKIGVLQVWMVAFVFVRETSVTLSRFIRMRHGQVIAAEKSGKIKTVFQIVCITVILLFLMLEKSSWSHSWSRAVESGWILGINALMLITVILTLNSGLEYFLNLRKLKNV